MVEKAWAPFACNIWLLDGSHLSLYWYCPYNQSKQLSSTFTWVNVGLTRLFWMSTQWWMNFKDLSFNLNEFMICIHNISLWHKVLVLDYRKSIYSLYFYWEVVRSSQLNSPVHLHHLLAGHPNNCAVSH